MEIFVDIDNTVFETNGMDYENSTPMQENIERVNQLYERGHYIVYWTARGMRTGIDWRDLTEKQLKEAGAKYHELRLNKPPFDLFIDDKVINSRDWEQGKWLPD